MKITNFIPNQSICLQAPAKINLFLDCLSKRSDGYHEISTVMSPITLWDELTISAREDGEIELQVDLPESDETIDPAWQIPDDQRNLVWRAAKLTQQRLQTGQGCSIRLHKTIPAAAGLGGGSSDAAATIVGCLLLWSSWSRTIAGSLAAELGSDINFFLGSADSFGLMHATGRGEKVQPVGVDVQLNYWLLHPPLGCSTDEVYKRLSCRENIYKSADFLAACQSGQESKIGAALFNALQLPAIGLNKWILTQLELLAISGCMHRIMTGSGSSCFGIVPQDGSFELLRSRANCMGINRVYEVRGWSGESIEKQLRNLRPIAH